MAKLRQRPAVIEMAETDTATSSPPPARVGSAWDRRHRGAVSSFRQHATATRLPEDVRGYLLAERCHPLPESTIVETVSLRRAATPLTTSSRGRRWTQGRLTPGSHWRRQRKRRHRLHHREPNLERSDPPRDVSDCRRPSPVRALTALSNDRSRRISRRARTADPPERWSSAPPLGSGRTDSHSSSDCGSRKFAAMRTADPGRRDPGGHAAPTLPP